jgi:hypothetical protein
MRQDTPFTGSVEQSEYWATDAANATGNGYQEIMVILLAIRLVV